MAEPLPIVRVGARGEERLRGGHLWVFGDELRGTPPGLAPGRWVRVLSRAGDLLGTGTLNLNSRIALRLVSRGEVSPDKTFLARRIAEAAERRAAAGLGGESALRMVFSEGDFLPGLIVDRYAGLLCVQILTAGMESVRGELLDVLWELFSPRAIVERSEGGGRRQEGLPERREIVRGSGPARERIDIDGLSFLVDALEGPKTGFFLDQRENRRLVRSAAAGRSVLDAFSSTGAFGMYALAGGARSVLAVDASEGAIAAARDNAERNGFAPRWEGRAGDAFRELRELSAAGARFDLVVLDPPSFARSREAREGALRGYRDVNRLGIMLLAEGGILATSSCTQLVDVAKWRETLRLAAADAGADLQRIASGGQPPDHPVLLGVPETDYLKFALYLKRSS